ncbi:MAG: hypothetical protein ACI4A7_05025 [Prevotella sp.]
MKIEEDSTFNLPSSGRGWEWASTFNYQPPITKEKQGVDLNFQNLRTRNLKT